MSLSALKMNLWLNILLALVVALQSLAAIGDASRPHHPATLHYAHDHEHSHAGVLEAESSRISSSLSFDQSSDHCHQNHANFHTMLVTVATDIIVSPIGLRWSDYLAIHTSVTSPSLFRPPIA